jgi:DNA-binding NtrC family response regulator
LLLLEQNAYALLLLDLNFNQDTTSGREGLQLLEKLAYSYPDMSAVVLTGWGNTELAVRALQLGARDFLEKPWDNDRLTQVVRHQVLRSRAQRQGSLLSLDSKVTHTPIATYSPTMQKVLDMALHIAGSDVSVLITGESGTGKGLLARTITQHSLRANQPFVQVNLGALPETLMESELFGHVRGAFTDARHDRPGRFELAHQGTLFLDELGNASPSLQRRLLTVLESNYVERVGGTHPIPIDVRVITATNAVLKDKILQGLFREDLYYRVNTVELHMPSLRERPEDILLLAQHFLNQCAQRFEKDIKGFEKSTEMAMLQYAWPGNVRELEHTIERAALMAKGRLVSAANLYLPAAENNPSLESMTLQQAERYLVQKAWHESSGNAELASRRLGLSRSSFYRLLAKIRGP